MDNTSHSALAFPLRLQNAQLQKTDEREAYETLVWIMARSQRGSWPGSALFGFREEIGEIFRVMLKDAAPGEQHLKACQVLACEINCALAALGLMLYEVEAIVLEEPPREMQGAEQALWFNHSMGASGATFVMRRNADSSIGGHLS